MPRCGIQIPVVSQVFPGHKLCRVDDLACVAGEMFHGAVDGFQHRHVVALHGEWLREALRRERSDHAGGFIHDGAQAPGQTGRRDAAARCELRIALADIRLPTHRADDPLPDITAQMQHQVADRIFIFRAACPNLLRAKAAQAILDAAVKLPELAGGVIQEKTIA